MFSELYTVVARLVRTFGLSLGELHQAEGAARDVLVWSKGSGEITYDGDSMTGFMKMNADGQEMTTKYTGKRLGECD